MNGLSSTGWMVTSSDDMGVSAVLPVDSGQAMFVGQGQWVCRFNLLPITAGTQVRVACHLHAGGRAQDVSGAQMGKDAQSFLESQFGDVMLDGPYVRKVKTSSVESW